MFFSKKNNLVRLTIGVFLTTFVFLSFSFNINSLAQMEETYLVPPTSAIENKNLKFVVPLDKSKGFQPLNQQYEDFAQEVIELTNKARWENGQLSPLKRQDNLMNASMWYAQWMADNNHFDHTEPGGRTASQRATDFGYNWNSFAENIGAGYTTPQTAVNGWMDSSGHRANILNSGLREIGAGYAFNNNYTPIINENPVNLKTTWVQNFGKRNNIYPVVINREALSTDSREVSLYVYGQGYATSMRFRNENGAWSSWENYNPNKSWTLSEGNGTKTVSVEITNGTSEGTVSSSDTIILGLSCFPDIPLTNEFNTYICNLKNDNVIGGYPDGTYKPNNLVNRGAMAKFMINGSGMPINTNCPQFSDIPADYEFANMIRTLKCNGVISGYPDGTYKPNNKVNRGAMAKFIKNGFNIPTNTTCGDFLDVNPTHGFYTEITSLKCANVISGYPDGTYKPNNLVNRGAMAKFVDNARKL